MLTALETTQIPLTKTSSFLNLYGLALEFRSNSDKILHDIVRSFKHFLSLNPPQKPNFVIEIHLTEPDYENLPSLAMKFVTPRNTVYQNTASQRKIIDYARKALVIENPGQKRFDIYSLDEAMIREIGYLITLSLFGQYCDRKGWLRIHALAMTHQDKAFIIMMPSGGGKSTLLFPLLQESSFKFAAEDMSVVDDRGYLLPFPMPLGFNPEGHSIPADFIWKEERMETRDEKYRIDFSYWNQKIETQKKHKLILMAGIRLLSGNPVIVPVSKIKGMFYLIRDAVVGIGVYQGLEFLLTHSVWDLWIKIPVFFKRLIRALSICFSHPFYFFYLSPDSQANADYLTHFIKANPSCLPQKQ